MANRTVAVDDRVPGGQTERGDMSRRRLLRLALAGAGVVATGPALSRTGVFGSSGGTAQQAVVPGVISGTAPMKGPVVPKFERELLVLRSSRPPRRAPRRCSARPPWCTTTT